MDRSIDQLKNIGPTLSHYLYQIGVETPEQLFELGAKEAFLRMHRLKILPCSFNSQYLFALEGAIRGCRDSELPKKIKEECRNWIEKLREETSIDS